MTSHTAHHQTQLQGWVDAYNQASLATDFALQADDMMRAAALEEMEEHIYAALCAEQARLLAWGRQLLPTHPELAELFCDPAYRDQLTLILARLEVEA